jgi:hypothetical protein
LDDHIQQDENMSMRMQVAEVGTYQITLYKNNDWVWDFWIEQKGHLLVKSTGTDDCEETKLLIQKHLYDIVMAQKGKKHFDPTAPLEWRNYLRGADGDTEIAG